MRKNFFQVFAWAVLSVFSVIPAVSEPEDADPVLKFYVSQADSAFARTNLTELSLKYSFVALTYFKGIGRKGVASSFDSTISRYFCSGATVDSTQILVESKGKIPGLTFSYPNVFTAEYGHNFFPNDIGGQDLAIGFTSYSEPATGGPSGIAVIDRESYLLRLLYLYYPNQKGYKRLTRSFRLAQIDGYIFPDSIWEVGAKEGIFLAEYYRLETGIEQIQLLRR